MPRHVRRGLWTVAWLAVTVYGFVSVGKQIRSGNDFPIYYEAARNLLAGRTLYDVGSGLHGYVYLPLLALVLIPFAWLPLAAAAGLWYAANVAFVVVSVRAVKTVVEALRPGESKAAVAWPLIALAGILADNLALGQVNLALFAAGSLAMAALARHHEASAQPGFLFGLVASVKPNTGICLVPLLLRGRGRAVLAFAGAVTAALLLPLIVIGAERTVALLGDWYTKVIVPAREGTLQGSKVWDQSPQAALRRLLVDARAFDDRSVHVMSLDPSEFARVSRAATLLLAAILAGSWLVAPDKRVQRSLLLDGAIAFCGTLLLTGYHLKAQFVWMLLPGAVAVAIVRGRWRRALLALSGALFVLSNPGLAGRTLSNWVLAYSGMTIGTLLVTGLLIAARLRSGPGASAGDAESHGPSPGLQVHVG